MDWATLTALFLEAAEICEGAENEDQLLEVFAHLGEVMDHVDEVAQQPFNMPVIPPTDLVLASQELSLHMEQFIQAVGVVAERVEQDRDFEPPLQAAGRALMDAAKVGLPANCQRILELTRQLEGSRIGVETWFESLTVYAEEMRALGEEVALSAEAHPLLDETAEDFLECIEEVEDALAEFGEYESTGDIRCLRQGSFALIMAARSMMVTGSAYYEELTLVDAE